MLEYKDLPDGWFHDLDIEKYRWLANQVPYNGTIIELGSWKGRSICSIADIIKIKNLNVYIVDTFEGTGSDKNQKEASSIDIKQIFLNNINKFGLSVNICHTTTDEASELLKDIKFDLVFIDSDHSYESVSKDIKNWLPKCTGYIAGHDYELDSVRKAVNEVFPNVKYIHGVTDPGRGTLWWNNIKEDKMVNNKITRNKRVDVIIPAFHAQNTISRTISSVIIQSIVDNISITVVNDNDGIGYSKIIDNFKDYVDIKEITLKENGGPGVARQYGIDNSNCPYFTCIDADDTFASAFALETLVTGLDRNPDYHTAIGVFVEQQPNLQFIRHDNDMVWMFGKLYSRSFINKYKIRFNETRANEDNGFNTIVRLVSSETEKVLFLPDIVYYWHYKEDSITRRDNANYSYNGSFTGFTDNMIYAIQHSKKHKPLNTYIDIWVIQIMAQLYIYYCQTVVRDTRYIEQNFNYCVKYYNEVFKNYCINYNKEHLNNIFGEIIAQQSMNMKDVVPDETIHQFIERLNNQTYTKEV